uniref:G-protein coupled receptors family 1 profile domain-containing protein n=1 Tax=Acrobeloides nanus TaxID=290746 RepID=A0A914E9Z5_9BILA
MDEEAMAQQGRSLPEIILLAKGIYVWLVPLMSFILLLAIVGNGLIVLSSRWIKRPISSYNKLCISLALIDAWAALLLMTGLFVNSYMPIVLGIPKRDECAAAVLEIFRISAMLTSNLHILALAIHHFVGILHPLDYKRYFTTSRQRFSIILFWIFPLFYVLIWFIVFPNDGFRNPACVFRFYYRQPFRFCIFISFLIPLLVTFVVYIMILTRLLGPSRNATDGMCDSVQNEYQRRMKSKLKLIFTTLLVLSSFAISWGTCLLYFVLVCREGCAFTYLKDISFETGLAINGTVNFMVALKLLANPLIYTIRMRDFRKSVSSLTKCIKSASGFIRVFEHQ